MPAAFSLSDLKKKNLSDVYHFIYRNPGCTRQSAAASLSMSLPTVAGHLSTLREAGLIEPGGKLASTVGRRAESYQITADARIAIGVEILPDSVSVLSLNLYGENHKTEKVNLPFSMDPDYPEKVGKVVGGFIRKNHYKRNHILGIGLGIQGIVSPDGSEITYGKDMNCTGLRIDPFASQFPAPCRFFHDAECACVSELWDNTSISDAIYISLGYHLGGAVLINGVLQTGLTGRSGTIEHITLVPDGRPCSCGRKGCAETYCSGSVLLGDDTDPDQFFADKKKGDEVCRRKWTNYLSSISLLIHNLHMVLDIPVILGGSIGAFLSDEDMDFLRGSVHERSPFGTDADYILKGSCRGDAVGRGAALPFLAGFLDDPAL